MSSGSSGIPKVPFDIKQIFTPNPSSIDVLNVSSEYAL